MARHSLSFGPPLSAATALLCACALWRNVYATLKPQGVTAPGGRASTVGVVGFLLGGGNNFFSSNLGLGCDNVVNFDVVLADGKIADANWQEHADLHKDFRGGSSNFGIVTRVEMQTVPEPPTGLWGGQILYPLSVTDQHIDAYARSVENISSYTAGSAVTFWAYTLASGINVSAALHDTSVANHLNMTVELDEPQGYRQIWITLTGRNDARFIRATLDAQPRSIADWKVRHDTAEHMVRTEAEEREARVLLVERRRELKKYSIAQSIDVEWEYLGYADGAQDPLSTYGSDDVDLVKSVAAKYDLEGVFQSRMPGGFKISKVL
ncbi:hypothetical protein Micbo1qcDRAFT_207714 [Microdochium bolleyi]|uniref:FAD-binding PCMH-type domain-containing protein n=1 Tax=Microdochium bolleyi TaxID=196109 RepID=A0A136IT58_9PEZI|nr:hypothetical protein Micbo1qcDRAFT_207714 [Microdochium bolleyi]